jgi:hypothetical protein
MIIRNNTTKVGNKKNGRYIYNIKSGGYSVLCQKKYLASVIKQGKKKNWLDNSAIDFLYTGVEYPPLAKVEKNLKLMKYLRFFCFMYESTY